MKKLLALLGSAFITSFACAQQDPQFSQNMFNKLWVNPATAGSNDAICFGLIYRSQWAGFDGSPQSSVFNFDMPLFKNKVGAGISVNADEIGFEQTLTIKPSFAYRMDLGDGQLAFGVNAQILQNTINGSKFTAPDGVQGDLAIPQNSVSSASFDMGAGLYYQSERLFAGFSSAHMLESAVDLDTYNKVYRRHYYGMVGYTFEVSPTINLKPMLFVKNVTNNTTVDVNMNAHFNGKYWAGLSWRNQDALVLMAGILIKDNLRLGYAYDYTTSELKNYSNGSHEVMLGYCFNVKKRVPVSIKNVRFL